MPHLIDHFVQPDPAFSPAPIWWWSGERLDIDRLRWQMDELRAMGIWQVVILNLAPSGPLYGSDADDPAFLSEAWWEIFLAVCEHARSTGVRIYFYDQIGFSGANFQAQLVSAHPAFSGERLGSVLVEGTGHLRAVCPGDARVLGAYAVQGGLVRRVAVQDGAAEITSEDPARLRLIYAVKQGFDYFSKAACARLLDTVHGEFFRRAGNFFGEVIVGSFQDELPHLPSWGATFAETFQAESGIDLLEHLDALYEDGGEESSRLRILYHRHRSRLAEEAMFRPFFEWHEKHGLICGFDQQGPARQGKPAACVQIYADYMATHRWYGAPGADLHGHAKIHSSLAWLYGRPRCWMEGFHSTGWGGTIEETFDWLIPWLRAGANFYNPHAVYYSTRGGFWEWAPPSTCWRQPYARHYKPFADTVSRLCKALAQGVHEAEVAVLFPTLTAQAAMGAEGEVGRWAVPPDAKLWVDGDARPINAATNEIAGCMCWMDAMPGVLDEAGLDYHFLDDESLAQAGIENARLTLRGCRFSTVILPAVEILDAACARRLMDFAKAGGTILALRELPSRILDDTDAGLLAALRDCIELAPDAAALQARLKSLPREIMLELPGLHRRTEEGHVLFIPACKTMATHVKREEGGAWFEYEHARLEPGRYAKETTVRFAAHPKHLVRWDPVTGTRRTVEVDADGTARVDFEGAAYVVLVWDDDTVSAAKPSLTGESLALSERWTMEYSPTLDNAFFDLGNAADCYVKLPRTWALESEGRTVWAGFGVQGWRTRPCAPQDLPPVPETFPAPGWEPVVYSPERGIFKDRIHHWTLGPKGHVPEEFVDLWEVEAGQSVRLCVFVDLDAAAEFVLAAGSAAQKSLRVHDQEFREESETRLWLQPLRLKAGRNRLEFVLTARRSEWLRFHWSLLRPGTEQEFLRPERIAAADAPSKGSRLHFRRVFHLASALSRARLQVAVLGVGRIYFDGKLLGRQGGFDPYALDLRVQPYDLPSAAVGEHEILVEVTDPGQPGGLFADLLGELEDGNRFTLMSDARWEVARDDAPFAPVAVRSNPHLDPSFVCLWRRPHPLSGAAWLEGPQPEGVCSPPLSTGLTPRVQAFAWTIPPGAREMTLPLCEGAETELFIGEKKVTLLDGHVSLGESPAPARAARLEVRSSQLDGGVFTGPIAYNFGSGTLLAGSWHTQGLGNYSGALRMRQTISSGESHEATLDLGTVRGTVEAWCNGEPLGICFAAPWTFELTLRSGENALELLVTNTLAPWMQAWSPTAFLSNDQIPAGVMGPVKILIPKK
jgi:hypothetical protein